MFKKRPRAAKPPSKLEPAYWRERLFKNTFTYRGRRVEVKGWSVKIQLFGKRKTFSLRSGVRAHAAQEACQIYHTILAHGWEGVTQLSAKASLPSPAPSGAPTAAAAISSDLEYWKPRLIHRKYPESPDRAGDREFSVRVEHARFSQYFPLGTSDETAAAELARHIHRTVVQKGWATANAIFSRELTLALRWMDDPLAWTYTTIHTRKSHGPFQPNTPPRSQPPKLHVAVLDPDAGIRFALATCANGQEGFRCEITFTNTAEALREIPRRRLDFILANYSLPDEPGVAFLEAVQRLQPGLTGLLYSVYSDSEHLFEATPGGAVGYMLKRMLPSKIFEPIADLGRPVTREQIATRVREYFQRLSASIPAGPPSPEIARLTPREHEILALMSKGYQAKEMADALGISIWTVHGHTKSTFEKLNVHTRTEAVVKYLQK